MHNFFLLKVMAIITNDPIFVFIYGEIIDLNWYTGILVKR